MFPTNTKKSKKTEQINSLNDKVIPNLKSKTVTILLHNSLKTIFESDTYSAKNYNFQSPSRMHRYSP